MSELEITEDQLKRVAYEANLDQLAPVMFHDCVTASNNKDGIELLRTKLARLIANHSTSLVRQLLDSVEEKGTSSTCKQCDGDGCSRCFAEDGWNSCRETLIQKSTQMGIEV